VQAGMPPFAPYYMMKKQESWEREWGSEEVKEVYPSRLR
jgi:hypothetical protein